MINRQYPRSTHWPVNRPCLLPIFTGATSVTPTYFEPSDLETLVLHLDANRGVTTSGTHGAALLPNVDSWVSRAATCTLTAATTTRPYLTQGPLGQQAVGFLRAADKLTGGSADSGSDRMVSGAVSGDFVALPVTVFWCGTRTMDNVAFDRAFMLNPGSSNNGWGLSFAHTTHLLRMLIGTGSATNTVNIGTPTDAANGTFCAVKFESGANASWMEGKAGGTSTSVLSLGENPTFQLSASANSYRGDTWEILTFREALSDAQRQKVEGYLAHKWGLTALLPVNHPYKNTRPLR